MSKRYEFLSGGAVENTREGMEDVSQEDGPEDHNSGYIYLVLGDPNASAAVLSGSKSHVLSQLQDLVAVVENSAGNDADDHVFVDDETDMHLCAWGRIPYAEVYRYGQQYEGQRIEQVTDLGNGQVVLRLKDGSKVYVEPDGDDHVCGDAADSQNHRYDPSVITTPLSDILDTPEDPSVTVTVTRSSGLDGAAIVFVDTNFEPNGSDGGPGLRIRVNDCAVLNGSGKDAFGSVAATGGVDYRPSGDGEKKHGDRTLTVRLSEITTSEENAR